MTLISFGKIGVPDFLISLHQTMEKEENEDIHTHSKQNNSAIESSLSGTIYFPAMS